MTKKCLLWVLAWLAMLLLSSTVAGALHGRGDVRDIDRVRYDVLAERIYEGTVGSKGRVVDGLMYFALRMPDGTVEVQIGPEEFVGHSGFKL